MGRSPFNTISSTLRLSLNVATERYHVDKRALFDSQARDDIDT